jgi:hypothetical protein
LEGDDTKMSEEVAKRLRAKFLRYANKLRKEEPELAQKIRDHIDDLVAFYITNRRDMTLDEFNKIISEETTQK